MVVFILKKSLLLGFLLLITGQKVFSANGQENMPHPTAQHSFCREIAVTQVDGTTDNMSVYFARVTPETKHYYERFSQRTVLPLYQAICTAPSGMVRTEVSREGIGRQLLQYPQDKAYLLNNQHFRQRLGGAAYYDDAGFKAFTKSLKLAIAEDWRDKVDVWVAFISTERSQLRLPPLSSIEMCVSVLAKRENSSFTNIGISRVPDYEGPSHKGLSMVLRGFAASMVARLYPE